MMAAVSREFVRQRAGNRCEYCLLPQEVDEWPFHIEHIIAKQHGGSDDEDNLCWACSRCNLYKGSNLSGRHSETGEIVNLFHPRSHTWSEHFSVENARIVGRTAINQVTMQLLHMNDEQRLELRQELIRRRVFIG